MDRRRIRATLLGFVSFALTCQATPGFPHVHADTEAVCEAALPKGEPGVSMIQVGRRSSASHPRAIKKVRAEEDSSRGGEGPQRPHFQRASLLAIGRNEQRHAQSRTSRSALGPANSGSGLHALAGASASGELSGDTSSGQQRMGHRNLKDGPKSAEWFGSFSNAESTFDEDGVVDHQVQSALRQFENVANDEILPPEALRGEPAEWFQESPSGGPKQAWQTYYPELKTTAPFSSANPPWETGALGAQQRYSYNAKEFTEDVRETQAKKASWFDTSVHQYDAFGRAKLPGEDSARRFIEWEQKTVNVTLSCQDVNCTAAAKLLVFDPIEQDARHCRLSVGVHATDFDDEYSRENVEYIVVNGIQVASKCTPMASGCGDTTPIGERSLYPCVTDLELSEDTMQGGVLNISGKLSPMVDECPIDGSLLSGVASVTCFIQTKGAEAEVEVINITAAAVPQTNWSVPLQCADPGCIATANIKLDTELENKSCSLTVTLNQTDFDGLQAGQETIEFIKVGNTTVAENLEPGHNPCKEGTQGNATEVSPFVAVQNSDVSAAARFGLVTVSAKLANMVDECGSNGFLLDAIATIKCL